MVSCNTIKSNVKRICAANFDKRIKIQTSSISGNNTPGGAASTAFADVATVWAMVKTSPNREFVDGVNVSNGINTDFFIRYNSTIDFTKQLWVEYNNERYKIEIPENIDKSDETVRLRSRELGNKNIQGNQR